MRKQFRGQRPSISLKSTPAQHGFVATSHWIRSVMACASSPWSVSDGRSWHSPPKLAATRLHMSCNTLARFNIPQGTLLSQINEPNARPDASFDNPQNTQIERHHALTGSFIPAPHRPSHHAFWIRPIPFATGSDPHADSRKPAGVSPHLLLPPNCQQKIARSRVDADIAQQSDPGVGHLPWKTAC